MGFETNNRSLWGRPAATSAVDALVAAVRAAAKDGAKRLKSVVDDYEYDSSRWSAGPRKATALIGLRVRVECVFPLPVVGLPAGTSPSEPAARPFGADCELRIDTSRGWGCWLGRPGIDDQDPDDVMRLAFEDQKQLLSRLVLEPLIGHYRFRTLSGLSGLSKRYRAGDFVYRPVAGGLVVSFTAEMEAY